MTPSTGDDPLLDHALLTKADALIRRNRADGVNSEADILPLLTDTLDEDLPELTDALDELLNEPEPAAPAESIPTRVQEAFAFSLDLDTEEPPAPPAPAPSATTIQTAVAEATARLREQLLAEHAQTLHAARAEARAEALGEARQMQHHAVQAALAQGREEAEINQWSVLQETRREAVQAAAGAMSERLIELDAQISQSINQWLAKELPALIATEVLGLAERLREQTTAHLRVTLLPEISEQISKVLESALKDDSTPR